MLLQVLEILVDVGEKRLLQSEALVVTLDVRLEVSNRPVAIFTLGASQRQIEMISADVGSGDVYIRSSSLAVGSVVMYPCTVELLSVVSHVPAHWPILT